MCSIVLSVKKTCPPSLVVLGVSGGILKARAKSKDRRYRYDHEDVIYTESLDAVPVSELSAEQCAEIEATPSITLGEKNNFVEDEVDVPSNVLPSTLVGCLFELLRSGGSQGFLRRLWNQFRTLFFVDSPYAVAWCSKTETLVVLVQILYPRVLRRLKSWLGDSPFSSALQTSYSGVKCTVRCRPDDSLREVCVVDEDHGAASCEAEMHPLVVLCRLLLLCSARIVFDSLSMWLVLWASVQWTHSQP